MPGSPSATHEAEVEDSAAKDDNNAPEPEEKLESTLPREVEDSQNQNHITCPQCGVNVDIRDEASGGFTVKMWEEHREGW